MNIITSMVLPPKTAGIFVFSLSFGSLPILCNSVIIFSKILFNKSSHDGMVCLVLIFLKPNVTFRDRTMYPKSQFDRDRYSSIKADLTFGTTQLLGASYTSTCTSTNLNKNSLFFFKFAVRLTSLSYHKIFK